MLTPEESAQFKRARRQMYQTISFDLITFSEHFVLPFIDMTDDEIVDAILRGIPSRDELLTRVKAHRQSIEVSFED